MSYRILPSGKLNLGESAKLLGINRATLSKWLNNPDDVPYQVPVRVCFMRVSGFWWGDEQSIAFWLRTNGNEDAWKARCIELWTSTPACDPIGLAEPSIDELIKAVFPSRNV
jgi:hypothetical protein